MRSLLTILLCSLTFWLHAQITITSSDMPAQGDTFRMSLTDTLLNFSANDTGPGQHWDYSHLNVQSQVLDSFVSLTQVDPVLAFAFFGIANLAVKSAFDLPNSLEDSLSAGSRYEFYNKTTGAYNLAGTVQYVSGVPMISVYDQPDTMYSFPLNYEDTDTSSTSYSIELPSIGGVYTWQSRQTEVDGYGTIITPLDTFEALRVRSEVYREDSISYQGTN